MDSPVTIGRGIIWTLFQAGEDCLSAIFSVVNTYAIQDTRLFLILTSFVHIGPLDMLTTGAVSLAVNCERV